MKKMVLIGVVLAMTGCANLKFQWSASYATDNLVEDLRQAQSGNQATQPVGEASK